MPVTMKELGLDKLSVEDRWALLKELCASLGDAAPPLTRLTDAKRAELDRRLAEYHATPEDVISRDRVRVMVLARFQ